MLLTRLVNRFAPRRSHSGRRLAVALLLAAYTVAAASSVRHKSIVFDELAHLTGGVSAWLTADYRLFPQAGQLPQRWAALPLVLSGYRFPSLDQPAWWSSNLEAVGYQFLYASGNDQDALVWRARLAMIPFGVLLGWICYAWARRLFGTGGGLVALGVFVFSPSMLAHGPLATSDLPSALAFTAALGCFWAVLHRPGAWRVAGSSLVMGLLFVTKMSAALMIPVAVALAGIRVWYGRPLIWRGARPRRVVGRGRQLTIVAAILAAHAAAVLLVIWASYGCRYATFAESMPGRDRMFLGETVDTLAAPGVAGTVIRAARNLRVLPETYLFGAAHVLNRSGRLPAFLNGRYSIDGWWYFFPYCWLVKTPLPVFGLFAAAALVTGLAACSRPRILRRTIYGATPLIVFLAVYWTAAMSSSLNLGERHLLPAYPAMFILAGGAGYRPAHRHRAIVLSVTPAAGAAGRRVRADLAELPGLLQWTGRRAGARLPPPR